MIQQVLHEPVWLSRMKAEDFRALTPLIYAHVNPYGVFELDMETRLPIEVVAPDKLRSAVKRACYVALHDNTPDRRFIDNLLRHHRKNQELPKSRK
jgi:hypothetical protein